MREVLSQLLWVGHAGDGRDFRELFALGIRAVVQLALEEPPLHLPREFILFRFPLLDGAGNDPAVLGLAMNSVAGLIRLRIPTLVCCGAGMSRSPVIAAAALSAVSGDGFDECLERVTSRGPADVSPALWADVRNVLSGG